MRILGGFAVLLIGGALGVSLSHAHEMQTKVVKSTAPGDGLKEEGEEEVSERVGPNFAVTAFDKEEGFQLSEKALKRLGIQFQALSAGDSWVIPTAAIVTLKQSRGVYRRVDGWISFVLIQTIGNQGDKVQIQSEDLQANDEIAIAGVPFLRMTDADLNSGTVDICAH